MKVRNYINLEFDIICRSNGSHQSRYDLTQTIIMSIQNQLLPERTSIQTLIWMLKRAKNRSNRGVYGNGFFCFLAEKGRHSILLKRANWRLFMWVHLDRHHLFEKGRNKLLCQATCTSHKENLSALKFLSVNIEL